MSTKIYNGYRVYKNVLARIRDIDEMTTFDNVEEEK